MLSRLFKSRARFDDSDPQIRRAAVLAIADEEAASFQDDFAELVRSDADPGVRRAALSKIQGGKRLEAFLADPDPEIIRAAAEAIARDADADALLHHPEVRGAAIRNARDPDSVARLIGDVEYDHELIRLAVESRNPKVRVIVADKLMKEASLVELERVSRDKDKNVNRLARGRLEEIKQARAEIDKALRRAEELTYTVETQLKAETDPLFGARLGVTKHDWQTVCARHAAAAQRLAAHGVVVAALTELTRRFDAGVAHADAMAAIQAARVASPPAEARLASPPAEARVASPPAEARVASPPAEARLVAPAADARVAPAAAVDTGTTAPSSADDSAFTDALAGLESLLEAIRGGARDAYAEVAAIHEQGRTLQDRWLAAADHRPPPEQLVARFHGVTHNLTLLYEATARVDSHRDELARAEADVPAEPKVETPEEYEALWLQQRRARQSSERVARTIERIAWPTELRRPALLDAAELLRGRLADFDAACHAIHEQLLRRLHDCIGKLEAQIDAGHLASAAGLEGEAKRLLHSLPAGTAKHVQSDFVALSARVQELKDWRTFATHPKREQFVGEMEALAAQPLQPALQAERIRELRQAWQDLGPITNHSDRRLFDRFNQAAENAFKPCREYFDAQAATRKFNLEQRRKICAELGGYLDGVDWDRADWRAAERILYAARDEWRKYHPVDRSAGRKLDTQFDALTARLHEKLTAQWDRNAAAKQAIVAEAAAIASAGGDSRDRIDKVKALQGRWRAIGVVPRRVDQRLWKEFRAACDAVFEQRDSARTEQRQAVESQLSIAEGLCTEFQRALEGASSETADADVLNEFENRFQALRELPRESARRIEQRFREMERSYRMLLRQAQHDAVMQGVDRLYDIDDALSRLEQNCAGGGIRQPDVMEQIAAIRGLDRVRAGAFAQRLQLLEQADAQALIAAAAPTSAARRKLAIEMEVAAGLDSPQEYQQDRLALQVDRLNQGMKHRRVMDEAPMQLAERWCRTGPVLEDDREVRERFFRACRIALE